MTHQNPQHPPILATGQTMRTTVELAQPGDWVEVEGTHGANPRRGEILEVLGSGHHVHFRVRWDEEHESLLYPAPEGGLIVHTHRRAADA